MKKLLVVSLFASAVVLASSDNASAQRPGSYSFLPFGFYQPYGASYGNALRTPPYFATNPPVYYGARHARPYGLSPFASPPLVTAGERYESRLRSQFQQPLVPTPAPLCNPYIHSATKSKPAVTRGLVRSNPFVEPNDRIAKK